MTTSARINQEKRNEVSVFNFENHGVRALTIEGEIWWVAKDICVYFGDTDHKRSVSKFYGAHIKGTLCAHLNSHFFSKEFTRVHTLLYLSNWRNLVVFGNCSCVRQVDSTF